MLAVSNAEQQSDKHSCSLHETLRGVPTVMRSFTMGGYPTNRSPFLAYRSHKGIRTRKAAGTDTRERNKECCSTALDGPGVLEGLGREASITASGQLDRPCALRWGLKVRPDRSRRMGSGALVRPSPQSPSLHPAVDFTLLAGRPFDEGGRDAVSASFGPVGCNHARDRSRTRAIATTAMMSEIRSGAGSIGVMSRP